MTKNLQLADAIDENLKLVIDEDGTGTPISLSKDYLKVNGDIECSGISIGDIIKLDAENLEVPSAFTIKTGGDVIIDTEGSLLFNIGGFGPYIELDALDSTFKIYNVVDADDYFKILVGSNGYTKLSTIDDSGSENAYMNINPQGDLWLKPQTGKTFIVATKKFYFDSGNDTYITESSADVLDIYVGDDKMLTLDEATDKITMGATNWVAGTVSGGTVTEFSAANSAYAGMILGYTRLQGDLTDYESFEIQNALTVEDSTHQISFKTPPSENVEIECSVMLNTLSIDTIICVGLSTSALYNSVGEQFEYDIDGIFRSDDEADDHYKTFKFVLGASELEAVGVSNTFYIGFSTAGITKAAYVQYGLRASHGLAFPPFLIKATALPTTIYDGT